MGIWKFTCRADNYNFNHVVGFKEGGLRDALDFNWQKAIVYVEICVLEEGSPGHFFRNFCMRSEIPQLSVTMCGICLGSCLEESWNGKMQLIKVRVAQSVAGKCSLSISITLIVYSVGFSGSFSNWKFILSCWHFFEVLENIVIYHQKSCLGER